MVAGHIACQSEIDGFRRSQSVGNRTSPGNGLRAIDTLFTRSGGLPNRATYLAGLCLVAVFIHTPNNRA